MNPKEETTASPRVSIFSTEIVQGGEEYNVIVEVLNLTDKKLSNCTITPTNLVGRELEVPEDSNSSKLSYLKRRRRLLAEEMRTQAEYAYLHMKGGKTDLGIRFLPISFTGFNLMKIISSKLKKKRYTILPAWSRRAFDIDSYDDVESLESSVILNLSPDSEVLVAWNLNKNKIQRLNADIDESKLAKNYTDQLSDTSLLPGSTYTTTFRLAAPHVKSTKKDELIFNVSYTSADDAEEFIITSRKNIKILASAAWIMVGAALGSMLGFFVKHAYVNTSVDWVSVEFLKDFVASVMLALLFAALARNTPENSKSISADDIYGGMILGSLAGLFSTNVIDSFSALLST